MRVLLAAALVLAVAVLLAACGGEGEKEPTATPAVTASATAAVTKTATGTPAVAAVSPTPRRDAFRRGARTPTTGAIVTGTPRATATPRVTPAPTVAPTVAPTQTQAALLPSWQTSAPREPVTAGTTVELGIRNENGAPGETYAIAMLARLPDQQDIVQEGQVSGDAWTNFYISDTTQAGTYMVIFGLPQSDYIYAEDSFDVAGGDVTTLTWQVSAPREPIALGDTAELGLRNKWGSDGECYDFVAEVLDPDGNYASGEDTVCAAEWTYLSYYDTWVAGTYSVYYSIQGQVVATDSFEVSW